MSPVLPCARVQLEPGFARRLERLAARGAAARARREGFGPRGPEGGGSELVGHRAWRPGDDPRAIDWALSARASEPWLRLTRREGGQRWQVVVDASASMGAGPPGKLQRAGELALGLVALGLREGARVRLRLGAQEHELARPSELAGLLARVDGLEARGARGLSELARAPRRAAGAERLVLIGDLASLAPRELVRFAQPGRALAFVALVAPSELPPRADEGAVEWWDPESDARLPLVLEPELVARYRAELEALLARLERAARASRARLVVAASDEPFEALVEQVLRP